MVTTDAKGMDTGEGAVTGPAGGTTDARSARCCRSWWTRSLGRCESLRPALESSALQEAD